VSLSSDERADLVRLIGPKATAVINESLRKYTALRAIGVLQADLAETAKARPRIAKTARALLRELDRVPHAIRNMDRLRRCPGEGEPPVVTARSLSRSRDYSGWADLATLSETLRAFVEALDRDGLFRMTRPRGRAKNHPRLWLQVDVALALADTGVSLTTNPTGELAHTLAIVLQAADRQDRRPTGRYDGDTLFRTLTELIAEVRRIRHHAREVERPPRG